MEAQSTIFALSSGALPSGVAVVRVSGSRAREVLQGLTGSMDLPPPRKAVLRTIRDFETGNPLDRALVLWFPGPSSFTGEDCIELHLHGSRAVVAATLACLGRFPGCCLAEAGAFTRRAFENGQLDLPQIEGIADLIHAETETQRQQALRQMAGYASARYEEWRTTLIWCRAQIEAVLDFIDQEDVKEEVPHQVWTRLTDLIGQIQKTLEDSNSGERIRTGLQVMLMGRPNAGKSSLLNCLARREVAIVTEEPGTTRDVLEVHLDLEGLPVTLLDTAGLRATEGRVEQEGIRRALERMQQASLILWLEEGGILPTLPSSLLEVGVPLWLIQTKRALWPSKPLLTPPPPFSGPLLATEIESEDSIEELCKALTVFAKENFSSSQEQAPLITRLRHRLALQECATALSEALATTELPLECRAESLRVAGDALGRLLGRISVDAFLDIIFKEFCVGK